MVVTLTQSCEMERENNDEARLAELCKIVFCGVKTVQNYKSKLDVERNRKNIVIV